MQQHWDIAAATALYNVDRWGGGYFGINDKGNVQGWQAEVYIPDRPKDIAVTLLPDGRAIVTGGVGTVSGAPVIAGNTMTVNLTAVADADGNFQFDGLPDARVTVYTPPHDTPEQQAMFAKLPAVWTALRDHLFAAATTASTAPNAGRERMITKPATSDASPAASSPM